MNSWASGAVSATPTGGSGYSVGGLAGIDNDLIGAFENVYATGAVTGGADGNRLGGLIGILSPPSAPLTNGYATGNVTGGAAVDTVSGLVGDSLTLDSFTFGEDLTATGNSYYRDGNTTVGTGDATRTTFTGIAARTLAQLQGCGAGMPLSGADSSLVCTGVYTSWSTVNWDFGNTSQLPALKFADHTETSTPDCTEVPSGMDVGSLSFRPGDIAQPYCGKLLPNQPGR